MQKNKNLLIVLLMAAAAFFTLGAKPSLADFVDYTQTTYSEKNTFTAEGYSLGALQVSSDGSNRMVAQSYNWVYTSSDMGSTWVKRDRYLNTVIASGNGLKLFNAPYSGQYAYTSNDGGASWTQRTSLGQAWWTGAAISSDGNTLVVSGGGYPNTGYIYTSTDGGSNWIQRTSAGYRYWSGLGISSNGSTIVLGDGEGGVYISTDTGANWTTRRPGGAPRIGYTGINLSSDGSKIAILGSVRDVNGNYSSAGADAYVYTSSDYGNTWTRRTVGTPSTYFLSDMTMSADGLHLAAVYYLDNGTVWLSNDGGATWTSKQTIGGRNWQAVTMSKNGVDIYLTGDSSYHIGKLTHPTVPSTGFLDIGLRIKQADGVKSIAIINTGTQSYRTGGSCVTYHEDAGGTGGTTGSNLLDCGDNNSDFHIYTLSLGSGISFPGYQASYDTYKTSVCGSLANSTVTGSQAGGLGVNYGSSSFSCNTPVPVTLQSSPLRIAKNGVVYNVALVSPTDSAATKSLIRLSDGTVKALRRF